MCLREAGKLLKSINAPAGVKSLNDILCEYVTFKEISIKRQHLLQTNPLAASISAVLDQHTQIPAPPHLNTDSTKDPKQHQQQRPAHEHQVRQPQQQATTCAVAQLEADPTEQDVVHSDFISYPAATPATQPPLTRSTNQQQDIIRGTQSSRHRKGAPPRKRMRSDGVLSPVKLTRASSGSMLALFYSAR